MEHYSAEEGSRISAFFIRNLISAFSNGLSESFFELKAFFERRKFSQNENITILLPEINLKTKQVQAISNDSLNASNFEIIYDLNFKYVLRISSF